MVLNLFVKVKIYLYIYLNMLSYKLIFIVYGALVEYVSYLSEEGRDSLKNLIYDDACHLKKFAENDAKRRNLNEYTQFIGNIPTQWTELATFLDGRMKERSTE